MLLTVPKIVFQVVALGPEGVVILVFNLLTDAVYYSNCKFNARQVFQPL
jgi:hypothetical protein